MRFKLLTLDVMGTVFKFKEPPNVTYARVASNHGIRDLNQASLATSFKNAYKTQDKQHPHFGATSSLSSKEWWHQVVHNTFQESLSEDYNESRLNLVAEELYHLYSTGDRYEVFPDFWTFINKVETLPITVGVLSNADIRLKAILADLKVLPYFDFVTIAEEAKCSKPDEAIFKRALEDSGLSDQIEASEVLHLGDDPAKDYAGARSVGWKSLSINRSNNDVIETVPKKHVCRVLTDALPYLLNGQS